MLIDLVGGSVEILVRRVAGVCFSCSCRRTHPISHLLVSLSHFPIVSSHRSTSNTYNGDLATKVILDIPGLDRIGGILGDHLEQVWGIDQ